MSGTVLLLVAGAGNPLRAARRLRRAPVAAFEEVSALAAFNRTTMYDVRRAVRSDTPELSRLIDGSVRALHRDTYTASQIDLALATLYGVDTVLIDDGTYFVVEAGSAIVACGGWSKRATLHGSDRFPGRSDELLDPSRDGAKIRAFFVLPSHIRRGLASFLLERCERDAAAAGFGRAELSATLTGAPFYAARGYIQIGRAEVDLPQGESLPIVIMERTFRAERSG